MTATTTLPPCPRCNSTDAVRILYGMPTHEAFEEAERGKLMLGGCVIGDESPDFHCRGCGNALPWVAHDDDDDLDDD